MELKEGMYVRTKKGIFQITNDKTFIENKIEYIAVNGRYTCIDVNTIIKASNNIIDLIEVGDVITTNNLCGQVTRIEGDKIYTTCYDGECCYDYQIQSIVTKEQFESMQCRVEEK